MPSPPAPGPRAEAGESAMGPAALAGRARPLRPLRPVGPAASEGWLAGCKEMMHRFCPERRLKAMTTGAQEADFGPEEAARLSAVADPASGRQAAAAGWCERAGTRPPAAGRPSRRHEAAAVSISRRESFPAARPSSAPAACRRGARLCRPPADCVASPRQDGLRRGWRRPLGGGPSCQGLPFRPPSRLGRAGCNLLGP